MDQDEMAKRARIISTLLAGFPPMQGSSPEMVGSAFLIATERYSVRTLDAAARRYMHGEVPGQDKRFAPSAIALADQCEVHEKAFAYQDKHPAHERLPAPQPTEYPLEHRREMMRRIAGLGISVGDEPEARDD